MMRHVGIIAALIIALLTAAAAASAEEPSPIDSKSHPHSRRALLFQGERLKQAHARERAQVDSIPTDTMGVDEFEAEWSDPSWQAGGTGRAALVTSFTLQVKTRFS
jgi:hypothetical protein